MASRTANLDTFYEERQAQRSEVRSAVAHLVQRGGTRFLALVETNTEQETKRVHGVRKAGSEFLPASFSAWLSDNTALVRRDCEECKKHPRGICDICATS